MLDSHIYAVIQAASRIELRAFALPGLVKRIKLDALYKRYNFTTVAAQSGTFVKLRAILRGS